VWRHLRVSAALSWRFIVVIAALYVIVWLAGYFSLLIVPMAIALLRARGDPDVPRRCDRRDPGQPGRHHSGRDHDRGHDRRDRHRVPADRVHPDLLVAKGFIAALVVLAVVFAIATG
jgi:hypothetical protein